MTFICQRCGKVWAPSHRQACRWYPGKGAYTFAQLRWWALLRKALRDA